MLVRELIYFSYFINTERPYSSDVDSDFSVVAGTNKHAEPKQHVNVKKIIRHQDYNMTTHNFSDLYFVYVRHDIGKTEPSLQTDQPAHDVETTLHGCCNDVKM